GGEEFVVLLPGTDIDESMYLAERIRSTIEAHRFVLADGTAIGCTISLGVSSCPEDGKVLSHLIDKADAALYRAKLTRNAVARAEELPVVPRLEASGSERHPLTAEA